MSKKKEFETLSKTAIGYSHLRSQIVCQDFSCSYSDSERKIITACDGHGGKLYIRSHKGSKFASMAFLQEMMNLKVSALRRFDEEAVRASLCQSILNEWKRLVNEDIAVHPFRKKELKTLGEEQCVLLKKNPIKAYGTTLNGVMTFQNQIICISIGDGGLFLVKDGDVVSAFPESEDEPVANLTYSMCGRDAITHMHVGAFDARSVDAVIACTDGVLGAYQSDEDFNKFFVRPTIRYVLEGRACEVKDFISALGTQKGIGDDVSLAVIVNKKAQAKFYQ
ncbi:MAG: protein phosphatase 2C domain-containing protein [Clostridia bacterium]|nr:protein phosphatase 2C domain-containing protein [Clostridia bacterium]